jgi:glycosyltransferase involved in cell wall biosynthesis
MPSHVRVLVAHNFYTQPGGEDVVFAQETELLRRFGHYVVEYSRSNDEIAALGKLKTISGVVWSAQAAKDIAQLIDRERPEVAHFHNTMPLISPAVYYACRKRGVPVVQTLHNYRLICPGADLFRAGRVCEQCLGHAWPWPSIIHGCYHGSRIESTAVALMLTIHRSLKTWRQAVAVYIALTEFERRKLIEGGLPPEKIVVKPNFVDPDPGPAPSAGRYAIFLGRFRRETIIPMLEAWQRLTGLPLKLVGGGPELPWVLAEIHRRGLDNHIEVLNHVPRSQVFTLIRGAQFLLFPSPWYETFGMTMIEAFACGVPVIAAGVGTRSEIVEEGKTGLHYVPGNAQDLAEKVQWAVAHPTDMQNMGAIARDIYLTRYTAERNYSLLMAVYDMAAGRTGRLAQSLA